jgi:hypothetical protein
VGEHGRESAAVDLNQSGIDERSFPIPRGKEKACYFKE